MTLSVLCAGILVADIFVPPLERLPLAGELLDTDEFLVQPGGCAANAAIVLRRLGVEVSVIGCVGDDPFGDFLVGDLAARGIDTGGIRRAAGVGTSKTVIVSVRGEDRRFIHSFGANATLCAADISDDAIASAGALYIGGYLVLPALGEDAFAERLLRARELGVHTIVDPVVPGGRPVPTLDRVAEVLRCADFFVPNDDEARALTGEVDPGRQAAALVDAGAATVVIKLGERGALAMHGNEWFELPAAEVEVVEPSGAGDAFGAGLILGLLEGWNLQRSVEFASVLGASACTRLGCWAGVFTRAEADAFLAEHPFPLRAGTRA